MPTLRFEKMEGAGNDYIFLDRMTAEDPAAGMAELAVILSDRHTGIGSDGLIVLARSARANCRMLMWNADGSRAAMCGNGIRCLAKLAYDSGYAESTMTIESDAGVHAAELVFDGDAVTGVRVDMGDVTVDERPLEVEAGGRTWSCHRGDAGNPHAVVFCDGPIDDLPVAEVGRVFQRHSAFPDGVNVEFVRVVGGALEQRTYERGSEETLACGTGATVAAVAAMATGRVDGPAVDVRLRGGTLRIERSNSRLVMEGPARTVFRGEVPISL